MRAVERAAKRYGGRVAAGATFKTFSLVLGWGLALGLAGCGGTTAPPQVIDIALIGFNDFHGHLEAPQQSLRVPGPGGTVALQAGGVATLASAIATLKARTPHHAVVSAGDLVGASPMVSSLFLDEPTVEAMNLIGLDFNAVGNHEFDRGWRELLRLQHGGCEQFTQRAPCQISQPFGGARFGFLAANVQRTDGQALLPATGTKRFAENGASVTVGFIGMTLRATPALVAPSGVAGLRFADEAATANAQAAQLRAQGADIVVLALHEGGSTTAGILEASCAGLSGAIVPILERLDSTVDVVVSGHTHQAYVCDYASVNPQRPFLLTSAGQHGTLLTDIALRFDTGTRRLVH
ncbi:MAG: metallophosphoesterase, partial [Giesbergeria sp.]|nr:metallophosphoesterase [Giesbergeria sp.]